MKVTSTRWYETEKKDYNAILAELLNNESNSFNTKDTTRTFYRNISTEKLNSEPQYFYLDGEETNYDIISFSYDKVRTLEESLVATSEEISNTDTGFIIVYTHKGYVNYIINKHSGALLTIRRLLNYTPKNREAIVDNMVNITSDFFIWLIYKVYNNNSIFKKNSNNSGEQQIDQLIVESVVGFKGNSDDEISRITADGNTVMNLISSLTFLLESNNLEFIKINIQYKDHKDIIFRLNTNGSIMLDLKDYIGPHKSKRETEIDGIIESSKTLLLVYHDILPLIAYWYTTEKDEEEWGSDVYEEFLESLSTDIKGRIDNLKSNK